MAPAAAILAPGPASSASTPGGNTKVAVPQGTGPAALHHAGVFGTNDNIYYAGTPGQTFNAGSGLGIPDLSKLAAELAAIGGPAQNAGVGSPR